MDTGRRSDKERAWVMAEIEKVPQFGSDIELQNCLENSSRAIENSGQPRTVTSNFLVLGLYTNILQSRSLERQEKVLREMSACIQDQREISKGILKESKILRRLTWVLVALTTVLIVLTFILVWREFHKA